MRAFKLRYRLVAVVSIMALALMLSGASPTGSEEQSSAPGYVLFPGITQEEIDAVEAVREKYDEIIIGLTWSSQAFISKNGEVGGAHAMVCRWLTEEFGILFKPVILDWDDLLDGLESGAVHMTCELVSTPERQEVLYMSEPVGQHLLKVFSLAGSPDLGDLARRRSPMLYFLEESTSYQQVLETANFSFTPYFVKSCDEAARALLSGQADAFFDNGPVRSFFEPYEHIQCASYKPLQFQSQCVSTPLEELSPVITAINRYLTGGSTDNFLEMKNQGVLDYNRYIFRSLLSDEELRYIDSRIQSGEAVPVSVQSYNYPTSFYNAEDEEFQGMAVDILREIEKISGLRFEAVNDVNTRFAEALALVESGDAAFISELLRTPEREGSFIWSDTAYSSDNFALLSRSDMDSISTSDILFHKVGLIESSGYTHMFTDWFPQHTNVTYFKSSTEAFYALEYGEVDLLMSTNNFLLNITNYNEMPFFKVNILFDQTYDSLFGFNPDEEILASVVNKAQRFVDTEYISEMWKQKVFDYRAKVSEQKVTIMIIYTCVLSAILILTLLLLRRYRQLSRNLEKTVQERTEALREQTAAAEDANQKKSDFLARMSHEIRTPLNAVVGMAHVAKREAENPKTSESLDWIITSSSHLMGIINNVLDISKIEAGKFQLAHEAFSLTEAVHEVEVMFAQRCADMSLEFIFEQGELQYDCVMGDKLRLKQVLINILGNAVKFTKSNVRFSVLESESPGKHMCVRFSMTDDGQGIPPEEKEKLFQAFEQSSSNSSQAGGTGLGLTISQNLVQQMGGQIEVESEPGKGSSFCFTLCLEPGGDGLFSDSEEPGGIPDLRGRRILLAEDIEINAIILTELLADTNVEIQHAFDGSEALEMFRSSPPGFYELIFMDIQMPVMGGYEAAEKIRSLDREDAASVPIIAMTANAYQEDIDRAHEAGMNGHLAKPLDVSEVMRVLGRHLIK